MPDEGKTRKRRYAAKLLFQFRVVVDGESNKRRPCEERIVTIRCCSARQALRIAQKRGHCEQFDYINSADNPVYYEFIGVLELMCLERDCKEDEVWYELREMLTPMERRDSLLPEEDQLSAICNRE